MENQSYDALPLLEPSIQLKYSCGLPFLTKNQKTTDCDDNVNNKNGMKGNENGIVSVSVRAPDINDGNIVSSENGKNGHGKGSKVNNNNNNNNKDDGDRLAESVGMLQQQLKEDISNVVENKSYTVENPSMGGFQ